MRILLDAIHADLLESLLILFEDRLGWEVYVPVGMEWFDHGIFRYGIADGNSDLVARQFLSFRPDDRVGHSPVRGGVAFTHWTRVLDAHPGRTIKMVTLDQAYTYWDCVIATLAENEPGLRRFAVERGAHYGIQVGNQGADNIWGGAQFALLSVTTPGFKPWKPHVTYHQEFHLEDFYADGGCESIPGVIQTRVQCFTGTPDYKRFLGLATISRDLTWRWFGHCGTEDEFYGGNAPNTQAVASSMHVADVGYHVKRWSDGYGHVGFNWFAIGRPVLGSARYYADKLMGPMWVEGETSFDIDAMTDTEVVTLLRRFRDDREYHARICAQSSARFRSVVSFEAEAAAIKTMMEDVLSGPVVTE